MSRCFECRAPVDEEAFVCTKCQRAKTEARTARAAFAKVCGARGDSEDRALGGAKVHLSQKERLSIERHIGVPVADAQDARKKMKERGFRFLEKGEEMDRHLKAQKEWVENGGRDSGVPCPKEAQFQGWDAMGMMRKPEHFDFAERLAYHKQRLGEA